MNATSFLESILEISNCIDSNDDKRYIATKVIEHCDTIGSLSLDDFLQITNINANQFKKFYKMLGCKNYVSFKETIDLWIRIRRKQLTQRYQKDNISKLAKAMLPLTTYEKNENLLNLTTIDKICQTINDSDKIIIYGAEGLLNLTHDFQLDMRLFGKNIVRSSVNEANLIVPGEHDFICLLSMTGRIFYLVSAVVQAQVLNSGIQKMLISQHALDITVDYNLFTNTENDYYEGKYVLLFYLDLIKTRYYEMFVLR